MKRLEKILFVLGCALLVALVWKVGPSELWNELGSLGWGLVPFVLAEVFAEFIHTVAWRHCLPEQLRSVSLFYLFRVRMAGYAINYLTPTAAMGGEITKISLLASRCRMTEATSGVLISKVCFAGAHLIFVAIGAVVILKTVHLSTWQWVSLLLGGLLVSSGIVVFFLLQKHGKLGGFIRWLVAKKIGGEPLKKAASVVTAVDEQLQAFYRHRRRDLCAAVGWHLVGYSMGIIPTWCFLQWLQPPATVSAAAVIWFLGMSFDLLTFVVPMNAGSLEGTRMFALNFLGYLPRLGMVYGIALRLGQIFCAAAGLGLRATFREAIGTNAAPVNLKERQEQSTVRGFSRVSTDAPQLEEQL
jgi:hypothetical protein